MTNDLREAEAAPSRPASGEPVAWRWLPTADDIRWQFGAYAPSNAFKQQPLYTAPPAATGREEIAKLLWDAAPMRDIMDAEALADAILALGPTLTPQDRATSSPPQVQASHNSGERDPSAMPDFRGGETSTPSPQDGDADQLRRALEQIKIVSINNYATTTRYDLSLEFIGTIVERALALPRAERSPE